MNKINISVHLKYIAVPLALIGVLLIVLVVVGNIGYSQVQTQISKIDDANGEVSLLEAKHGVLSSKDVTLLDPASESAIAMPARNQGVLFVAQLRTLADQFGVDIVGNKVSSATIYEGNLSRSRVNIEMKNARIDPIVDFFNESALIAPLSTIEKVNVRKARGVYTVEAEMYVYWAPFPDTLPALTQPVVELSAIDEEILKKLSSLRVPSFTVLNPTSPRQRSDPFQ